jgi:hypothetical protein
VTSPSLSLSLLFLFIVGAYRDFLRGGLLIWRAGSTSFRYQMVSPFFLRS